MKQFLIAVLLIMVASTVGAVTYENKKGAVTFDHEGHQAKAECSVCHEGTPAKIEVDKTFGHKTCKNCHKEQVGPAKCNGCHVK